MSDRSSALVVKTPLEDTRIEIDGPQQSILQQVLRPFAISGHVYFAHVAPSWPDRSQQSDKR